MLQLARYIEEAGDSPLMSWIRDHLAYEHDYCLIWPFGRNSTGYGIFGREGKQFYVHRYICEIVHGAPPTQQHQAAHSCARGHEGCVNHRHLSWKTIQENQLDRHTVGVPHTGRKRHLSPAQVLEIRASDDTAESLGRRFGVSDANIRHIRSGRTYRHLLPSLLTADN